MSFAAAAAELRRQEIARLSEYVTPPIEAFRSLTPGPLREQIALMMERLGHTIVTDPTAPDLVTIKDGGKRIVACATPSDPAPTGTRAIARLHDAVIAANAQRGIFVTARTFTPDAVHYAKTAPIDLVDGDKLITAMNRSRAGVVLPQTYKAMCHDCGGIVQHSLDKGEALPCSNGHPVASTISRAAIERLSQPAPPSATPTHSWRNMSPKAQRRRAIKAHNHRVHARAISQHRGDS
jgi:hypothetical protein